LWQFRIPDQSVTAREIEEALTTQLDVAEPRVAFDATTQTFLVRLPAVSEADHQKFFTTIKAKFNSLIELDFQSIGPSVGAELRKSAMAAIGLVLVGISLYIAFAFRKITRPISSWKYGWVTLLTLFHDIIIPAGLLAFLGAYAHVEIDGNFIVALLVVAGFSVHDTIVVFDRIRENLFSDRGKTDFGTVINTSINQTLGRSINTSLTLILVLLALYFTGPISLRYFILTLLVGVSTGIYSSIFIASPILLLTGRKRARKG
jgi:preprotein translocase subunit SecF